MMRDGDSAGMLDAGIGGTSRGKDKGIGEVPHR
jgi:hypothetical protein